MSSDVPCSWVVAWKPHGKGSFSTCSVSQEQSTDWSLSQAECAPPARPNLLQALFFHHEHCLSCQKKRLISDWVSETVWLLIILKLHTVGILCICHYCRNLSLKLSMVLVGISFTKMPSQANWCAIYAQQATHKLFTEHYIHLHKYCKHRWGLHLIHHLICPIYAWALSKTSHFCLGLRTGPLYTPSCQDCTF